MKKMIKRTLGVAIGTAAVLSTVYVARKVAADMSRSADEDKSYGENAKKYFAEKWDSFKILVDQKNSQIENILANLKNDIVRETDPERRRELITVATQKVAEIKNDIQTMINNRRAEIASFASKINKSDVLDGASRLTQAAKDNLKKFFQSSDAVGIIDPDILSEQDYIDAEIASVVDTPKPTHKKAPAVPIPSSDESEDVT